jgi:hypothetical protein
MFMFVISFHGMGQAVAAACSQRENAIYFLMAHGHDRSVSSGRAATGGGATSALGAAGGGVADLSGKGGQKPLRLLRPALRTGDGCLLLPAPEEDLKGFSTFSALEFKNRHRFIPPADRNIPSARYDRGMRTALELNLFSGD